MQTISEQTLKPISSIIIACQLCYREMTMAEYEDHLQLHAQAELLADILSLSRQ
jgi:hypothetical protein